MPTPEPLASRPRRDPTAWPRSDSAGPAAGGLISAAEAAKYYARVSSRILPWIRDRPLHRTTRTDPNRPTEPGSRFITDVGSDTPSWIDRAHTRRPGGAVCSPIASSAAALAWFVHSGTVEFFVPQWRVGTSGPATRSGRPGRWPDHLVFNLDPGPRVGLVQCAIVARLIRDLLGARGEHAIPVSTGRRGLHLYVPVHEPQTSAQLLQDATSLAAAAATAMPSLVTARTHRSHHPGKVYIGAAQNNATATTIAPFSLRLTSPAGTQTVAAPRSWAELDDPALAQLDYRIM